MQADPQTARSLQIHYSGSVSQTRAVIFHIPQPSGRIHHQQITHKFCFRGEFLLDVNYLLAAKCGHDFEQTLEILAARFHCFL